MLQIIFKHNKLLVLYINYSKASLQILVYSQNSQKPIFYLILQMGNIQCCTGQAIKNIDQSEVQNEDEEKIIQGLGYINLLHDEVSTKFTDYKPQKGIRKQVGINVQNLAQLYEFIKVLNQEKAEQISRSLSPRTSRSIKTTTPVEENLKKTVPTHSEQTMDQIKSALFELRKSHIKNLNPLNISEFKNQHNHVQAPYFLPWIQGDRKDICLYIGEWKWETKILNINLPYGVGRLYIKGEIWEGNMETVFKQLLDIQLNSDLTSSEKFIQYELAEKHISQKTRQLKDQEYPIRSKINLLKRHLSIQLNGYGRKLTQKQEYCGTFVNGKLEGKGQYKNFQLDYSYDGYWVQGVKQGKGIQKTKMTHFEGMFHNNRKNGEGTLVFYLGQKQERQRQKEQKYIEEAGQSNIENKQRRQRVNIERKLHEISNKLIRDLFQSNLPNYKGEQLLTVSHSQLGILSSLANDTFTLNLKTQQFIKSHFLQKYVGQFENDLFHGNGLYQWAKGNCYIGQWSEGKMHGIGKFYWKDGFEYFGQYRNDLKHGKGQMKWDPFKRYRGNWAYGKKHGYGQQIKIVHQQNKIGVSIQGGIWNKNVLQKTKKGLYWFKFIQIPQQFAYKSILMNNIRFYYPQNQTLTKDEQMNIIMTELQNYFKDPCIYCGSAIKKREQSNQNIWDDVWLQLNQNIDGKEKKQPEACKECRQKMIQLERDGYVGLLSGAVNTPQ